MLKTCLCLWQLALPQFRIKTLLTVMNTAYAPNTPGPGSCDVLTGIHSIFGMAGGSKEHASGDWFIFCEDIPFGNSTKLWMLWNVAICEKKIIDFSGPFSMVNCWISKGQKGTADRSGKLAPLLRQSFGESFASCRQGDRDNWGLQLQGPAGYHGRSVHLHSGSSKSHKFLQQKPAKSWGVPQLV